MPYFIAKVIKILVVIERTLMREKKLSNDIWPKKSGAILLGNARECKDIVNNILGNISF